MNWHFVLVEPVINAYHRNQFKWLLASGHFNCSSYLLLILLITQRKWKPSIWLGYLWLLSCHSPFHMCMLSRANVNVTLDVRWQKSDDNELTAQSVWMVGFNLIDRIGNCPFEIDKFNTMQLSQHDYFDNYHNNPLFSRKVQSICLSLVRYVIMYISDYYA